MKQKRFVQPLQVVYLISENMILNEGRKTDYFGPC